jgi:hypothetical protein
MIDSSSACKSVHAVIHSRTHTLEGLSRHHTTGKLFKNLLMGGVLTHGDIRYFIHDPLFTAANNSVVGEIMIRGNF